MKQNYRTKLQALHARFIHKQNVYEEMAKGMLERGSAEMAASFSLKAQVLENVSYDLMLALDGEDVPEPGKPWSFDEMLGFDLK